MLFQNMQGQNKPIYILLTYFEIFQILLSKHEIGIHCTSLWDLPWQRLQIGEKGVSCS